MPHSRTRRRQRHGPRDRLVLFRRQESPLTWMRSVLDACTDPPSAGGLAAAEIYGDFVGPECTCSGSSGGVNASNTRPDEDACTVGRPAIWVGLITAEHLRSAVQDFPTYQRAQVKSYVWCR